MQVGNPAEVHTAMSTSVNDDKNPKIKDTKGRFT